MFVGDRIEARKLMNLSISCDHRVVDGWDAASYVQALKKLIEDHHRWTGSLRAREILDNWAAQLPKFVKVFPHEYRRALTEMGAKQEATAAVAKAKSPKAKA